MESSPEVNASCPGHGTSSMESREGRRGELYSPLEKLAKPSVRCVWAGPQKRPFHKLGWEIKAPDRVVTGLSLGVERWLSVSNKA